MNDPKKLKKYMSRGKKNFGKKLPQRFLQKAIIKLLLKKKGKFYSLGNITSKLKTKNSKDSIKSALAALLEKEQVIADKEGRFTAHPNYRNRKLQKRLVLLEGRVDLTATGGAYIIVAGQERDVYIPKKYVNNALQGDIVKIEAFVTEKGRRPEGKIVEIIKRKRTSFIGRFQEFKNYGYVFVETPSFSIDIKVLPKDYQDAKTDDAVVADIIDFGTNKRHEVIGKIIKVLNVDDQNNFEMNSILVNNGFELEFPPEVIHESEQLSDVITEQDLAERRDMRETMTFTIDPFNAKDFDDAISYEVKENGHIEIGVHIADVTHFVRPGSALDAEAYKRSTSVYLVDRVCPMLPEKISNELCSLRPNEDKFSFSVLFTFDDSNKIVDSWMGKTLIHSDRRFTYEDAQEVLEGAESPYSTAILKVNQLAKVLNKRRFKKGSIDFDSPEVKFELDDKGAPIGIKSKIRKDAHKLIEEFMLLANKYVARYVSKKSTAEIPYVYRVHDLPDPDRLAELALLASEFDIKLNFDSPKKITESLNSLSADSEAADVMSVLKPMAIRCMAKAAYSTENIGHYGLGFEFYSHFTSPIRRYSDVLSHRVLYDNLNTITRVNKSNLEEQCKYISLKERDAITAERASIKYKQVEYYASRVGETFDGMIRNIIDKGFFVELIESQSDGFVPMATIDEDVMIHPAKIKVTGRKSKHIWKIGDLVKVQLTSVDMDKRQIELNFVDDTNEEQV